MNFQFTDPFWLLLFPPALAWVVWLSWKSDTQISRWRRRTALTIRVVIVSAAILALAGLQWKKPMEGLNVFFVLDRSDSIPSPQQEAARQYTIDSARTKKTPDRAGVLVFGSEASLETSAQEIIDLPKINAVVGTERTDIAGAIRLGTAAFPETGQKRIVLISDGNENVGDALAAVRAARPLGVTVDVIPISIARGNDTAIQKLSVPSRIKKGQTFEAKIFVEADTTQEATIRLYRNDQPLGEQKVQLTAGKNLYSFPQTLSEPGFYSYNVQLDTPGDGLPQNNRATGFTSVRGEPRALLVSSQPAEDQPLADALRGSGLEIQVTPSANFPNNLAELQSFDLVLLSNVAAGDLGNDFLKLLESAVRDFGVGLVCIGGDQTYAAGGYRGTPLEATLPVNMELDSKKILPNGAVVLVMHGMEFMNGNQIARDCALGVLDALGPRDELGVVLWDGTERWLFPLDKVGDKSAPGRQIAGMNQGDLPSFQNVMSLGQFSLQKSGANLKHMIIFSDGDPVAPTKALMDSMVADKITVTTVLIAGHFGSETMEWIAANGNGRFYNVNDPGQLPQIFVKEAAVILKSAIFEEPFRPQLIAGSELVRGIAPNEYPILRGYVCTTPKARAELPLVSDKGDPILAHWQYGLGRAVAFTSDAKAKWAAQWLSWDKYRQFWTQVAQWSLRRVENADFSADVTIDKGEGRVSVEALDANGDYRNFLNLQTVVVGPTGERQIVRLEQTGPGRYEAVFPTKEVGAYMLNLTESREGQVRGSMAVGASIDYSPEFTAPDPNHHLLRRLAETGGGKILDPGNPADSPFLHDRKRTFQPHDLWEWLLKFAILLFPLDVAVRRIQLDREEWLKATENLRRYLFFWKSKPRPVVADESLAALLVRRGEVRARTPTASAEARPDLFQPVNTPSSEAPPPTPAPTAAENAPKSKEGPEAQETTTSRLLAAKRRARKRD